ncbi:MAG: hypothetical protein CO182_08585, partial [Lysobacterales bacterium CG_4_9_14_3_um_filter_62_6]
MQTKPLTIAVSIALLTLAAPAFADQADEDTSSTGPATTRVAASAAAGTAATDPEADAATTLSEITVTARRREEALLDV